MRVFSGATLAVLDDFFAFPSTNEGTVSQVLDSNSYTGGARVAVVDATGNGFGDILTVPGPIPAPEVRVYDGLSLQLVDDFFAYDLSVRSGLFVGG